MTMRMYVKEGNIAAGMTMKDARRPEENNMGLHACLNPQDVLQNRRELAKEIGVPLGRFVCGRQTHSANFHRVAEEDRGRGAETTEDAIPDTDALYTYEPNIVLGSLTADCVPVLLWNEAAGLVGAVHSGWQGTVKEITPKLLRHLTEEEGLDPLDFRVRIGAALSQEKFEVDRDVYERFRSLGYADDFIRFNGQTGKWHIDNQKTVETQLLMAGIPPGRIAIDRSCTYKSPGGFSYREDKKAGRHLSWIVRTETPGTGGHGTEER
ncbi:peptidoglycan editing factor PgeF [Bhargavaea ullalensis]